MSNIQKFEKFHILLWLFKDMSWLMGWKTFGIFMIVPTISFAAFITYKFRKTDSELFPNLAVVFWIAANSFWMITEFQGVEEIYRIYAVIPFGLGFFCLFYYYFSAFFRFKTRKVF